MTGGRIAIVLAFVGLLAVPLLVRPSGDVATRSAAGDALTLIVITPHNEQIRYEFARAFDAWHQRNFDRPVNVLFNVPGGTSEIRRMLEAQFRAALESGRQAGGDADLVFGGGSYEHTALARPLTATINGESRQTTISVPVTFDQSWLDSVYGENSIGGVPLYDPDRHWFGVALSGFGIVYNRDALSRLDVPEPREWRDLCHPRLQGWVALVNPQQSGSIKTTFEAILHRRGWDEGWRTLRRAAANARYFSASSLKPPIDVSQGNAAAGMCIDFYGRYQSQALRETGVADRIGYVDPPGGSTIDSDPISMLRNAPHPQLARRFIEFCLSEEGQALWQLPRRSTSGLNLGPHRFELRRLPIVRSMYQSHVEHFIDAVNPFELAAPAQHAHPDAREFIGPLFAAMAMDNHHELKLAWAAIAAHPQFADPMMRPGDAQDENLRRMLALFDAMPSIHGPDNRRPSLEGTEHLADIREGWLRGRWARWSLWPAEDAPADAMRREFGAFFAANYREIVRIARTAGTMQTGGLQ